MPKFRAFLFFAAAFVGAFLTVGFSISVARPHLNQDSVTHFLLNDGWRENAALSFVNEFFNLSTEDVYQQTSAQQNTFYGKYKHIRSELDYSYHKPYSRKRVIFQDQIIDAMLDENGFVLSRAAQNCTRVSRPWLIFMAGAMGAGKSHTIKILHQKGRFPLQAFTSVDPDRIRHRLPEFESYVEHNPEHAGELTRKESGLIAEVLTEIALERGHNVLVDGSLRDADWYQNYIQALRHNHPQLRLAILHVTAPRESVFENALNRAKTTGRVVPRNLLELSMEQVPRSVAVLRPLVDFAVEIHNSGGEDVELVSPEMNWEAFTKLWRETACAARVYHAV